MSDSRIHQYVPLSNKEALKIHGVKVDSDEDSSSDGGPSDFDDEYYKNLPPPVTIDSSKIVVIRNEDKPRLKQDVLSNEEILHRRLSNIGLENSFAGANNHLQMNNVFVNTQRLVSRGVPSKTNAPVKSHLPVSNPNVYSNYNSRQNQNMFNQMQVPNMATNNLGPHYNAPFQNNFNNPGVFGNVPQNLVFQNINFHNPNIPYFYHVDNASTRNFQTNFNPSSQNVVNAPVAPNGFGNIRQTLVFQNSNINQPNTSNFYHGNNLLYNVRPIAALSNHFNIPNRYDKINDNQNLTRAASGLTSKENEENQGNRKTSFATQSQRIKKKLKDMTDSSETILVSNVRGDISTNPFDTILVENVSASTSRQENQTNENYNSTHQHISSSLDVSKSDLISTRGAKKKSKKSSQSAHSRLANLDDIFIVNPNFNQAVSKSLGHSQKMRNTLPQHAHDEQVVVKTRDPTSDGFVDNKAETSRSARESCYKIKANEPLSTVSSNIVRISPQTPVTNISIIDYGFNNTDYQNSHTNNTPNNQSDDSQQSLTDDENCFTKCFTNCF